MTRTKPPWTPTPDDPWIFGKPPMVKQPDVPQVESDDSEVIVEGVGRERAATRMLDPLDAILEETR
jgi:hypothetical protein